MGKHQSSGSQMTETPYMLKADAVLIQLRAWLAARGEGETRLPPERQLCEELGIKRGELRKALALLESDGVIWRHVGKGTFLGARPLNDSINLDEIQRQTNPAEVMRTRLILEPALARDAALHASTDSIDEMQHCIDQMRSAQTWRQYEAQDNALHRQIARASGNMLALALFDALNAVRRGVAWSRDRKDIDRPPPDHHSFSDHDLIIGAIRARDVRGAEKAMLDHLRAVEGRLVHPDG